MGECFGKDENEVLDDLLENVVSLLVYGLRDVLDTSMLDGRLCRRWDGV